MAEGRMLIADADSMILEEIQEKVREDEYDYLCAEAIKIR